jgi:hypothetical protein
MGRQVWNKQRRHDVLISVDDVALGHETKVRWNDTDDRVWSGQLAHEPLVSVATSSGLRRCCPASRVLPGRHVGPDGSVPERLI